MPFPLLLAVPALLLLIGAGAAAVALWPGAKRKSFLLMGPEGSGKTTLALFLTSGIIPKKYFATAGMRRYVPTEDVKLEGLEMVAEIWDPAGDRDAIATWFEKAKQVDVLIYLISFAEALDPHYVDRIRRDTRQLRDWKRKGELKAGSRTVVVVTHMDRHEQVEDEDVGDGAPEAMATRLARETPAVQASCEELRPEYQLVAGSLVDEPACAQLAARLLNALEEAAA